MNSPNSPSSPAHAAPTGPGVVSSGWLAANSTFERKDDRKKLFSGLGLSVLLHGVFLAIILAAFAIAPDQTKDMVNRVIQVVYLQQPGAGGGGGGSPTPAPAKKLEIPKHVTPEVPIVPPPIEVPPPTPQLNAPVVTSAAQVMQAAGISSVSLQAFGGGGRGRGLGEGTGSGVGPGEGGGTGGGAFHPGNGVISPTLIKQVPPKYTSDAMRAKIQGTVVLDAVVDANGTVGEVQIVKSLDAVTGLDQEAIKAAKGWLFRPATKQGQAVPCWVRLELQFRIF